MVRDLVVYFIIQYYVIINTGREEKTESFSL